MRTAEEQENVMHGSRWLLSLLGCALVVLLVGGALVGAGLADEHEERVALDQVRIANDDLQRTVQARLDEARANPALASTSTEDSDLDERLDDLVRLDASVEGQVEALRELESVVILGAGRDERDVAPLARALNRLEDDMLDAARDRRDAASGRTWWSFWSTGALLAVLLVAALVVVLRGSRRTS